MTKNDLVRDLCRQHNLSPPDVEMAVNAFFRVIIDGLKEGRRVELRGFGTFQIREYDGYMGRNPRTGDPVTVPPKRLPFFKAGKKMNVVLNSERS